MAKIDQIVINDTTYEIVPEIAPLFDDNENYIAGNCVIYNATLYRFTSAHTGAWTGADVETFEVGEKLTDIEEQIDDKITDVLQDLSEKGFSEDAKVALLNCFSHVAWTDEHGQDYYDALEEALYPDSGLASISAVFTQGSTVIYPTTPLNDLKSYLVVTGHYNDGTSKVVIDYSLSGTLEVGTSTITVTKEGKTATFNVVVTRSPLIYQIANGTDLTGQTFDSGISAFGVDDDFTILASIKTLPILTPTTNTPHMLITNGTIGNQNVLRLSFDEKNGISYFVTNYCYGDHYQDYYTPGTVYSNIEHDVVWVMRNQNGELKKQLYIDGTIRVNKTDDLEQYSSSVFSGTYSIGSSPISAVVDLFRIYDTALSASEINSILDIDFSN